MTNTVVLDASAAIAVLKREPGADIVLHALPGARIGAANWAEIAAHFPSRVEWATAAGILTGFGVTVDDVTQGDAEWAAALYEAKPFLSLGDRLCLALAERLDADVLTADKAWGTDGRVRQIR